MRKSFKNKRYPLVNTDDEALLKKRPVQNVEEYLDHRIALQSDKAPIYEHPRAGGVPVEQRQICTRQVFSSKEVAETTVASLVRHGVIVAGLIERCKVCGFLHIKELK